MHTSTKFKKGLIKSLALVFVLSITVLVSHVSYALDNNERLSQIAGPYIKYYEDRSLDSSTGFGGLTRSFQKYLGGQTKQDEDVINYGAQSYDQSVLGRIALSNNKTAVIDTYIAYYKKLSDKNNALINANGNYKDDKNNPILYGPYMWVRILGRDAATWWNTWDWRVDLGAAAEWIYYALEAYKRTGNEDYKSLAVLFSDYALKLQDKDGGFRWGPVGMYHPNGNDYFWKLKSTEQNGRVLYALEMLYEVTKDNKYAQSLALLKNWLKGMYDKKEHLFNSSAELQGTNWIKADFNFVAIDAMAFAPTKMMIEDSYFGSTQAERDQELSNMFKAAEARLAFLDKDARPLFFRFTTKQVTNDFGSVEFSSQMALQYLRVAGYYAEKGDTALRDKYLDKYYILVDYLDKFFIAPADDVSAKIAPYASFFQTKAVAGNKDIGAGYYTYNCQGALASSYYVFAKAGYDPVKLGGGMGIPKDRSILNLEVDWADPQAPYNSTGAASAQMILNYIRLGAGQSSLTQKEIYEYSRSPLGFGPELAPREIEKSLGHFDPYDKLISNADDEFDSKPAGNPKQGYNWGAAYYDPAKDPDAMNKYMRDICHWMAYTVTKERNGVGAELVARPNSPPAIPLYGSYNNWVVVTGYAASTDPCPKPRTDCTYTPDFTVYGFWFSDPLINGIGKNTYKVASECKDTYFAVVSANDDFKGKYTQVAEPPLVKSNAKVKIREAQADLANLEYVGVKAAAKNKNTILSASNKKKSYRDIIDKDLLADKKADFAFSSTYAGAPILVKRIDKDADYYLVPFCKKGSSLISASIILNAKTGSFKEASWVEKPEKLIKVDTYGAYQLTRRSILREEIYSLREDKFFQKASYAAVKNETTLNYKQLLKDLEKAKIDLAWKPGKYSSSPFRPFWRVDLGNFIFYVTQEGKVFSETKLNTAVEKIQANRIEANKLMY